jgi:hypothetical protein
MTLDVLVFDGRYAAEDPADVWQTLGWRGACVCIGVALDVSSAAPLVGQSKQKTSWKPTNQPPTNHPTPDHRPLPNRNSQILCSTLVFPVTARAHLRDRCAATLAALAAFSEAAAARLAAPGGPDAPALDALTARAADVRRGLVALMPLEAQARGELLPALGARRLDPVRVKQLIHRLRSKGGHWLLSAEARDAAAAWSPPPAAGARLAAAGAAEGAALRGLRLALVGVAPLGDALAAVARLERAALALAGALAEEGGGGAEGGLMLGTVLDACMDVRFLFRVAARVLLSEADARAADAALADDGGPPAGGEK